MKKMYWRPQQMSLRVLGLLAGLSAACLLIVEVYRVREQQPLFQEKRAAAQMAMNAFETVKKERLRLGIPMDAVSDPSGSGIIGELITPVTTNTGHLPAKQTSINPNFAAVLVHMLSRAGVSKGDAVAVGVSGSFPALNIAVYAAIEALSLQGIIISSVGASQWGANHPLFTWVDMENLLVRERIFNVRSIAVSPGGIEDRAVGLSADGRAQLERAMARGNVQIIDPSDYDASLAQRMLVYDQAAGEKGVKAYINVGGGTISVGTRIGKVLFRPGLNTRLPRGALDIDSVMTRYASRGVPVIHISKISKIAKRYGLAEQPQKMPPIGQGNVFVRETYNSWLAFISLVLVIAALIAFLRLDLGYRLFPARPREGDDARPQPMV